MLSESRRGIDGKIEGGLTLKRRTACEEENPIVTNNPSATAQIRLPEKRISGL